MGGDLRAFFQTKCTHSSAHLLSPPISVCKKAWLQSWHYSRDKRSEAADSCQINDCLPACFLSPPLVEGYWVIAIYLSPWCPPPSQLQTPKKVDGFTSWQLWRLTLPLSDGGERRLESTEVAGYKQSDAEEEEEAKKWRKSYRGGGEKMKQKVVATYQPKLEPIHSRQRGALRAVGCVDQLIQSAFIGL